MNESRGRDAIVYGVTLVAALGVGVLIGRSACSPEPEVVVEERVVTETPECPPCRPEVGDPELEDAGPAPAEVEPPATEPHREMPEAPSPPDPETRRRLLSWVRDRAPDLRACRSGRASTVRLTVTLALSDEGAIQQADINAPKDDLSGRALRCLRERMVDWQPPTDLVAGRTEIVFGLDL